MKDLYKGINPIYESMKSSMMEDKSKGMDKTSENVDAVSIISTAMSTFFTILLESKMENAKTVRGFQEIKNKILATNNFGAFRQYIISIMDSLANMDSSKKEIYKENIQFITSLLSKVESSLSDPKLYDAYKKKELTVLLKNFEDSLKEREEQMAKTNPKLFGEVVKQGLVVKEAKRTGEEKDVRDAEFRGAVFNKSKESIDAATAFIGMIENDKSIAVLKDNPAIKKYKEIAEDLYKKAQDLQMIDRKPLFKVVTPSGDFKRIEYMRKQALVLNEIIRQKKEYERIKNGILNQEGIDIPPSPATPIIIPDKKTEETGTGGGGTTPKPKQEAKSCEFPISLGTKCTQVGELQNKLMELVPSAKKFLEGKGKADKIYGKATSLVTNIIWGYISNNKNVEVDSDLTKEKYDAIMKLTTDDIDLDLSSVTPVRDSLNLDFKSRLQENENLLNTPILSFDSFSFILNEQESSEVKNTVSTESSKSKKIIKDSCVQKSIESGKIEDCFGIKSPKGEDKKEGEEKREEEIPTREEWTGLKYVQTHSYPISFDESLLSAWTKEAIITAASFALPGSGYVAKAGSTAMRGLAIRGAERVGAEKLAQRLSITAAEETLKGTSQQLVGRGGRALSGAALKSAAKSSPSRVANALSLLSKETFAKYGKVLIPKRIASGLIGGSIGSATLDFIAGKNSYMITVTEGYIEKNNLLGAINGLIDTIDGYVSDEDWATIASVMAVIKGSFTIDDGKAISSWKFIKENYQSAEGESIVEDIKSVTPKVGEVEGFPKLMSSSPLSSLSEIAWSFAKNELVSFISKLESNEGNLAKNLEKLPKNYLEALENGDFAEYDEEGNIEGIDTEKEEQEEKN